MTRVLSASDLKTNPKSTRDRRLPKPNTRIREVYDQLHANEGKPIHFDSTANRGRILDQLKDIYGCDIRWWGLRQYVLVGEIVDDKYIDYMIDKTK